MSRLSRAVLVIPAVLVGCDTPTEDASPTLLDTEAYRDQEILVRIDDGDDGVARMLLADEYGFDEVDRVDAIGVSLLDIGEGHGVKDTARLLENDHRVLYAEPNYIARASAASDDPYLGYQWNLDQIDATDAWAWGIGNGITVAVLDTGVKDGGPDGIAHLLRGWDAYNDDDDPTDRDGHGTFVAGTIGQDTDNGIGVAGIAPGVDILPVKVLSDQGYGDIDAIVNGIVYATDNGAHVINMSLGSAYPSQAMKDACQYAYDQGVVLVAASGNEFASSVNYPGAYDTVIAVGATRYDRTRASYSNTGSGLALMAPGGDLSRDDNGDGYADGVLQETIEQGGWTYTFWEGTSMATPHVTAAAALVMAQGDYSPDEVFSILAQTATDIGPAGYDTTNGYGIIDVDAAVALAAGSAPADDDGTTEPDDTADTGTEEPSTTDTTPPTISNVSGWTQSRSFTITWVTDEPADSYVDFRDYGEYGDDDLTTSHTLQFTGQRGSTYYFDVKSTDAAGNTATDGTWYIRL